MMKTALGIWDDVDLQFGTDTAALLSPVVFLVLLWFSFEAMARYGFLILEFLLIGIYSLFIIIVVMTYAQHLRYRLERGHWYWLGEAMKVVEEVGK